MTDSGDSTMASSETTGAAFKMVTHPNKSKRLKVTLEQKVPAERTHSCTIRAYFQPPRANSKFNPVSNMRNFLAELLKYEPSIVVVSPTTKAQIVLATEQLPTNEAEFKKFFTITTDSRATAAKQRVIIGCDVLSERTIQEIKFDRQKPQFLEWMKKNKIFFESDSLGVNKTTTVGYLTRLHPQLTNRGTLKKLLNVALEDITIDPELAVELNPDLKASRIEAMTNGDVFIPSVPPFEVYKTRLIHGRDKTQIYTHVIGIKCASSQAKLLKEFYSQLASPEVYEKQIGVFIPTGAIHLLGTENYINLIRDNNAFLNEVTTIPLGDFQHPTLDIPFSTDSATDIEQMTLQELIAEQKWCLGVERTNLPNKVMITTTKTQITQAREWLDKQLPLLYQQHVADKLDVTLLDRLIPRRLDKPVLTAASTAYAKTLQQRTSTPTPNTGSKLFAKPPRPTKNNLFGLTFDEKEFPALPTQKETTNSVDNTTTTRVTSQLSAASSTSSTSAMTTTETTQQPYDYKKELERISHEIETKLKRQFETIFTQMEQKLEKLETLMTQQATNSKTQDHKLDQFLQQHVNQKAEQDQFNETFTKRLDYLVVNIERLLRDAYPLQTTHPLPTSGNGQL